MHRFDKDGKFKSRFGAEGSGKGPLYGVVGLAADKEGNIYTANAEGRRVVKFNKDGKFLYALCGGTKFTSEAELTAQFDACPSSKVIGGFAESSNIEGFGNSVRSLAVATIATKQGPEEWLFVADWANDRIQVFRASNGEFLSGYCDVCVGGTCTPGPFDATTAGNCSSSTTLPRVLTMPTGIAVGGDGTVYITSASEKPASITLPSGVKAKLLLLKPDGYFATFPILLKYTEKPQALPIAVDAMENVYVLEPVTSAEKVFITKYRKDGFELAKVAIAQSGGDAGTFAPWIANSKHSVGVRGLAINEASKRLIVPDPGNARFQQLVHDSVGDACDPCPTMSDPPEPGSCVQISGQSAVKE